MASTLTIKFLTDDFIDGWTFRMDTIFTGTITQRTWDWVTTRSGAFEVTTGTPTGNAGETTAINFQAAFALDLPTGFTAVVQNVNEVLITSTTAGEDFVVTAVRNTIGQGILEGVIYTVTYDNVVVPVDISNVEFILTRSPHYINTPFFSETTESATFDVYIWSGDLASIPATPTYTFTKVRPSVDYLQFNSNISSIVDESLDGLLTINTTLPAQIVDTNNNEVKWIKWVVSYNDPLENIPNIESILIGTEGFGYYSEGVNPTKKSTDVLTSCDYRKVSRDGIVVLAFVNNGDITDWEVTTENLQINEGDTVVSSNNSNKAIQYIQVDVSDASTDNFLTITLFKGAGQRSFVYEIVDECRYEPKQIIFQNKYGVYDSLTLFKKSNETINVTNDEFVNAYISDGTYSTTAHQKQKINIQGTETLNVNSGYIKESENAIYKEMMLSEKVYLYQDSELIPINVKSSSLEFKTRVNDKLVNYNIEFEYAYNLIQNV